MRERRSRLPAAAAVVVALAAAAMIGRLTAPPADPPPAPRPMPVVKPLGLGATRTVAGVPVGFPRTREGAVAAMAAYGRVLADPRVQLDDRRRRQVAEVVGTPRYARALEGGQTGFAALRDGPVGQALRPGARAVFLAVPVAYRTLSFDGTRTVIVSWGVAIAASDTGIQPRAGWETTTTTAVWQHGDWKVDRVASTSGPVPAGTAAPSQAASFIAGLAGMRALRHAP